MLILLEIISILSLNILSLRKTHLNQSTKKEKCSNKSLASLTKVGKFILENVNSNKIISYMPVIDHGHISKYEIVFTNFTPKYTCFTIEGGHANHIQKNRVYLLSYDK